MELQKPSSTAITWFLENVESCLQNMILYQNKRAWSSIWQRLPTQRRLLAPEEALPTLSFARFCLPAAPAAPHPAQKPTEVVCCIEWRNTNKNNTIRRIPIWVSHNLIHMANAQSKLQTHPSIHTAARYTPTHHIMHRSHPPIISDNDFPTFVYLKLCQAVWKITWLYSWRITHSTHDGVISRLSYLSTTHPIPSSSTTHPSFHTTARSFQSTGDDQITHKPYA